MAYSTSPLFTLYFPHLLCNSLNHSVFPQLKQITQLATAKLLLLSLFSVISFVVTMSQCEVAINLSFNKKQKINRISQRLLIEGVDVLIKLMMDLCDKIYCITLNLVVMTGLTSTSSKTSAVDIPRSILLTDQQSEWEKSCY